MFIDVIKNNVKAKDCSLEENYHIDSKEENSQINEKQQLIKFGHTKKSKIKFIHSSDSEDDDDIKKTLKLNRKKFLLSSNEETSNESFEKNKSLPDNVSLQSSKNNNEVQIQEKILIETDSPRTPKKCLKAKRKENIIISDSDSNSPNFKHSPKRTPIKRWIGPDYKLNLKSLGLGKELDSWIQLAKEKPIMSSVPVNINMILFFIDNIIFNKY